MLADGQQVLNFTTVAAFKSIIVSAPQLQVGKTLTVLTNAEQTNSREISESIQLFPITQSKKTEKQKQTKVPRQTKQPSQSASASASESTLTSFGTMTAHPASGNTLGYWLYTPNNVGNETLSLIVYLHGGSGRGSDLSLILV